MKRWEIEDQHPKVLYRLRTSRSKNTKLKSVKIGNQIRFKVEDVEDWERRNIKNFLLSLLDFSDDDADDLDPAAGTGEKPNYP